MVQPGNVMKVTLSCDHRVVDGVVGSKFLNTLKALLENPIVLLGQGNILIYKKSIVKSIS